MKISNPFLEIVPLYKNENALMDIVVFEDNILECESCTGMVVSSSAFQTTWQLIR